MAIPSSIAAFWGEFTAAVGNDASARFYEAFHFDDNQATADELAGLVLRGVKRATASLVWSFEAAGKKLPQVGDLSVVTTWSGEPVCVIETVNVDIVPFDEVDAGFAATEGEGDGSLAYWQRVHTAYFARECQRIGRAPGTAMPIVCERFQVVFRAAGRSGFGRHSTP